MPAKFKETAKILINRQAKTYKRVNYFLQSTKTEEIVDVYENSRTTPKRRQKMRNELVRRNVL